MATPKTKSVKVLLKFAVEEVQKPITYTMITEFNLRFSILQADVKPGQGGRLILDLSGEEDKLTKALDYARSEHVGVTVLSKSVCWDNETCVHCGACTAVCPTKALTVDPETAELSFANDRCVVCEMCTHACPTGALRVDLFA